jgi:endoglucanase
MSERPLASRVGELVGGKYRIVRFLAEGGMGAVYEAQHAVVKRRFAIKLLHPDLATRRDILARFEREAATAGGLENENVAATVDFGIAADGTPYIVMEYLVGEDVASLLEREDHLAIPRAVDVCLQACRGIQAAHAAGILHRDLKPQNLFVCRREDGTDLVKVLDFGVAKLRAINEERAATGTGSILGTPAYMSPEQARGDKCIDYRADVYALGAILYELVSGRTPHPGDSNNAILHHIFTQPPIPLDSVRPGLPGPLVESIERALSSDLHARHASVEAFGLTLAPWARCEVWAAAKIEDTAPMRVDLDVALHGTDDRTRPTPSSSGLGGIAVDDRSPAPSLPRKRYHRRVIPAAGIAVVFAALVIAIGFSFSKQGSTVVPRRLYRAKLDQTLDPSTHFFVPPPHPGAGKQIADLSRAKSYGDAALLAAMAATPQAVWFHGGSPQEVQSAVRRTMTLATHEGTVPALVAYYLPYRDCAQYGAGGAADSASYTAWIDGFAKGLGNDKAVVILEPNGLGIIPYSPHQDGSVDWCRPTITDAQGRTVPAPGASPADRYALLARAIDSIESQAPNAAVYLDGTHGGWLPVGEVAYRLARSGIDRVRGFALNVSNFRPTPETIKYGTWVAKCIAYAGNPTRGAIEIDRYRDCPSQRDSSGADDWSSPDKWYAANVDTVSQSTSGHTRLAHFVIDTGRNGRGPQEAGVYAVPPYSQPPAVIAGLLASNFCNPPHAGLGQRPTADTRVPLVDAYLWIKAPGESDGTCDIAGTSPRAWDFSKYNPWGISGDAQKHFDPLWGMVDPEVGEWFGEYALELAHRAIPPLR